MSALPMDYRDHLNRQDVVDRARLVPAQVIKVVPAQDDLVTAAVRRSMAMVSGA
jgi:hypothetical protein